MASGDDAFTLPYWDWDNQVRKSIPAAFRDVNSPLYDERRAPEINMGEPLPAEETDPSSALTAPDFLGGPFRPGFGGAAPPSQSRVEGLVEGTVHDNVHGLVGGSGDMSILQTAALDPIFWLHHCNIDRLWDVWLSSGRSNPPDQDWEGNRVQGNPILWTFFDGQKALHKVKTADVIPGGGLLDYRYDDLRGHPQVLIADNELRNQLREKRKLFAMAGPPGPRDEAKKMQQELFGAETHIVVTKKDNSVMLGAAPVTVQANIDQAKRPALMRAIPLAARGGEQAPAVLLNIENVKAASAPGVVYRVYLNQKDADKTTNPGEANYVGSIGFFLSATPGHGEMTGTPHGQGEGKNYSFDISRLAQSLKDRGKWDENKLDVTFVSKGVGGTDAPKAAVTFDRVSLTIER